VDCSALFEGRNSTEKKGTEKRQKQRYKEGIRQLKAESKHRKKKGTK
jgi:hypothetical protein